MTATGHSDSIDLVPISDSADRIILGLALTVIAGVAGIILINGLLTGAIDGPARGRDLVAYAESPRLFVLMSAIYGGVFLGGGAAAVRLLRTKSTRPR
jgi:hypothetical protein